MKQEIKDPAIRSLAVKGDRCYFCHKPKEVGAICECRRQWSGEIRVRFTDGTTATYYPRYYGNARLMEAYYRAERGSRCVVVDGPKLYEERLVTR